jgi:hypothetical protein
MWRRMEQSGEGSWAGKELVLSMCPGAELAWGLTGYCDRGGNPSSLPSLTPLCHSCLLKTTGKWDQSQEGGLHQAAKALHPLPGLWGYLRIDTTESKSRDKAQVGRCEEMKVCFTHSLVSSNNFPLLSDMLWFFKALPWLSTLSLRPSTMRWLCQKLPDFILY